jgi:glycosyltransferase involved in cell wall biosynthesis
MDAGLAATASTPSRGRVVLVPSFLQGYGGVEQWLVNVARAADRGGWRATVVSPRVLPPGGELVAGLAPHARYESAEARWRRRPLGRALRAGALARAVIRERGLPDAPTRLALAGDRAKPYLDRFWATTAGRDLLTQADVVHVVGSHPFGARAIAAAGRLGRPVVYNEVSLVTATKADDPYHAPFRAALGVVDVVVAHASEAVEAFTRHYDYSGAVERVDQWIAPALEEQLLALPVASPRNGRPLRVAVLARLTAGKGVGDVLAAVQQAGDPPIALVIGGDGPEDAELRAQADRLGVTDRVRFLGAVAAEERAAFYASCDVLVLASHAEGGPLTGLEAMAAGRAIVSTPVGAMPDRLADGAGARFVPVGDPAALAGQLRALAADPALVARLATAARARYRDHHTAGRAETVLPDLWSRLLMSRT